MKIKDYIISLYQENICPTKIKTDDSFNYYENKFSVQLNNGTNLLIEIIKYTCVDSSVVEFIDDNEQVLARAKGFDSVL